jgi:hypothetical protein
VDKSHTDAYLRDRRTPLQQGAQIFGICLAEPMQRGLALGCTKGILSQPTRDDDDVHIFVRWELHLARGAGTDFIVEGIKSAFDLVWERGGLDPGKLGFCIGPRKDTAPALDRLKRIQSKHTPQLLLRRKSIYPWMSKPLALLLRSR